MNKQKFIELLKKPSSFTKEEVAGLENVVRQYPYFQSAHLVLAKGSKITKDPKTKKRLSRAAVYCTDRVLLKKYITGELIFLDSVNAPPLTIEDETRKKPKKITPSKEISREKTNTHSTKEVIKKEPKQIVSDQTQKESSFDANSLLNNIKGSLEAYKENKKNFEEYIQNDEEDKAVNEALNKASSINTIEEIDENNLSSNLGELNEVVKTPTFENTKESLEDPDSSVIEDIEESVEDLSSSIKENIEESNEIDDFDISNIIEEIKNDTFEEEVADQLEQSDSEIKETVDQAVIEEKSEDIVAKVDHKEEKPKVTYVNRVVISGSNKAKPSKSSDETVKQDANSGSKNTSTSSNKVDKNSRDKEKQVSVSETTSVNKEIEEKTIDEILEKEQSIPDSIEKEKPTTVLETQQINEEFNENVTPEIPEVEKLIPDSIEKDETPEVSSEDAHLAVHSQGIIHRDSNNKEEDKKLSSGALRKAKMKKLKMQKDIINDFIDSSPQMPAPKQSPFDEEKVEKKDLAKETSETEDEIVSENMAIIYKNQKKIDKAIDIYNKLILKFPQKEAYFAARIKELKK